MFDVMMLNVVMLNVEAVVVVLSKLGVNRCCLMSGTVIYGFLLLSPLFPRHSQHCHSIEAVVLLAAVTEYVVLIVCPSL